MSGRESGRTVWLARICRVTSVLLSLVAASAGQPVDENAMFSDTATIVDSAKLVNTAATKEEQKEKKSVSLSGDITSAAVGTVNRDWFDEPHMSNSRFSSTIVGNLMLDVRLLQSFKAFGNMEVNYVPDSNKAALALKELFIDANINKAVYFRAGKQVLQWGRCYFWNPTDLINIEKKSFIQKLGYREGTYGVKMHVPFGASYNVYAFLDAQKAPRLDSIAGAAKLEVLVGGTEMALSIWDKRGYDPVYGFDLSAKLLTIDINGELGLYQTYRLRTVDGFDSLGVPQIGQEDHKWVPRVCLSLGKSFAVMGVPDRLSLVAEGYYNQAGIADNKLNIPMPPLAAQADQASRDLLERQIVLALMAKGMYEPNSYSRWYAAFFGSLGQFITSDITLTLNGIANINQGCATITTGLTYSGLNDFTMGLSVNAFVGAENTEYTFSKDAAQVQVTAGVTF
jgi:hypothetical protein